MFIFSDPFFWAFISMFGLVGACAVVGSKKLGENALIGFVTVTIFFVGRFILVLPFCEQNRYVATDWNAVLGGIFFIAGLYLGLAPSFEIRALNIAQDKMELVSTGFYHFVRNPIYLGELLWCLGWAMMFRSIIGVVLVPIWWIGLLKLIFIEEVSLERALGQKYLDYKKKVKGRIIPGLPI